jgi:hypothetical protein
MANELRAVSGLNFGAFQLAHYKPGTWFKLASVPTTMRCDLTGMVVNRCKFGKECASPATDDNSA